MKDLVIEILFARVRHIFYPIYLRFCAEATFVKFFAGIRASYFLTVAMKLMVTKGKTKL